jgi:hypothetical protein
MRSNSQVDVLRLCVGTAHLVSYAWFASSRWTLAPSFSMGDACAPGHAALTPRAPIIAGPDALETAICLVFALQVLFYTRPIGACCIIEFKGTV